MFTNIKNYWFGKDWSERLEVIELLILFIIMLAQFICSLFNLSLPLPTSITVNTLTLLLLCQILFQMVGRVEKLVKSHTLKNGYLHNIISDTLKATSSIKKLRLYSSDGEGFFNALMGCDFVCREIELIVCSSTTNIEELNMRWQELLDEKFIQKVTIKKADINPVFFGMAVDTTCGVIGLFKPQHLIDKSKPVSTLRTYQITAAEQEVLNDFISWFDTLFVKLEVK